MWKKVMLVNFALILVLLAVGPNFVRVNRGFPELWEAEITVMDPDWVHSWYLGGQNGIAHYFSIGVSNKITSIIRSNASFLLAEIYVNHVPNKHINTVYVSLTDTSTETTQKVLALIDPHQSARIEFIEAPAPRYKVDEWRQSLRHLWDRLWYNGVPITSMSITPNGTILLGMANINQEKIDKLEHIIEGKIPPGILVIHEQGMAKLDWASAYLNEVNMEGLLSQEDDPDHDWAKDPSGPKVLSLDVLNPEENLNHETYYLTSRDREFYRFFPLSQRINDTIWAFNGPKPVKIKGIKASYVGVDGRNVTTLSVLDVVYSEMGQWVEGVLGIEERTVGSFQVYNRSTPGRMMTFLSLTLSSGQIGRRHEVVYLASHEGYVYDVPICGTGQPIARYGFGENIRVRGLFTEIDATNQVLPLLMVFEVVPGSS